MPEREGTVSAAAFRTVLDTARVLGTSTSTPSLGATAAAPTPRTARGSAALRKLKGRVFAHALRVQKGLRDADPRGQNWVSHMAFRDAVAAMGVHVPERDMNRVMRKYGRDKPGMVQYTDFNRSVGDLLRPAPTGPGAGGVAVVNPFGEGRQEYVKRGGDPRGGVPLTPKFAKQLEYDFAKQSVARSNTLAEAFSQFDPKGKGVLKRVDFVRALRGAGLHVTHDEGVALANRFVLRDRKTGRKTAHLVDLGAFSNELAGSLKLPNPSKDPDLLSAEEVNRRFADKMYGRFSSTHAAFRTFDQDKGGSVDHEEFRHELAGLGLHMSDAEFAKLVRLYDPADTGEVDHAHFNNVIGEIVQPSAGTHDPDRACTPHLPAWKESKWAELMVDQFGGDLDALYDNINVCGSGKLKQNELLRCMTEAGIRLVMDRAGSVFEHYKLDRDGFITRDSFKQRVSELAGRSTTPPEFNPKARWQGPTMSASQVQAMLGETMYRKFKTVKRAFELFDENKDFTVQQSEFREQMEHMGFGLTDYQFAQLIKRFDPHQRDNVTYAQFTAAVGNMIQPGLLEFEQTDPEVTPLGEWVAGELVPNSVGPGHDRRPSALADDAAAKAAAVARIAALAAPPSARGHAASASAGAPSHVSPEAFLKCVADAGVNLDAKERRELVEQFAVRSDSDGKVSVVSEAPRVDVLGFLASVERVRRTREERDAKATADKLAAAASFGATGAGGATAARLPTVRETEAAAALPVGADVGGPGSGLPPVSTRDPARTYTPRFMSNSKLRPVSAGGGLPLGLDSSRSRLASGHAGSTARGGLASSRSRLTARSSASADEHGSEFGRAEGEQAYRPVPRSAAYTPRVGSLSLGGGGGGGGGALTGRSAGGRHGLSGRSGMTGMGTDLRRKLRLDLDASGAKLQPETPAHLRFARSLRVAAPSPIRAVPGAASGFGGTAEQAVGAGAAATGGARKMRRVQEVFASMRRSDPHCTQRMSVPAFRKLMASFGVDLNDRDVRRLHAQYGAGARSLDYVGLMRDVYGAK